MELVTTGRTPAEVFPPGEFIKDEIEARGWSQADLAEILGRTTAQINKLIQGTQAVTPETARQLSEAFGTSAQLWLNLESAYRLSQAAAPDESVARKARLYERFPVREIVRRRWIEPSDNVDVLEKRLLDFFGLGSIDQEVHIAHAARRPNTTIENGGIWAWLSRARQLAPAIPAGKFSDKSLETALARLRPLLANPEEIRRVPGILADAGIRLVIVESMPKAKIDGATFWLDRWSPVIVLSLRFGRIDSFWHTLLHELGHVRKRDGQTQPIVDSEMVGEDVTFRTEKSESEKEADRFACEYSIPKDALESFIARHRPVYPKGKLIVFALKLGIHPGIVVGQLQHREIFSYAHHREMLRQVRDIVTSSALTDGWGQAPLI